LIHFGIALAATRSHPLPRKGTTPYNPQPFPFPSPISPGAMLPWQKENKKTATRAPFN